MLQKKICMLGASAVGKTSLVRQFVHSMFEDKYLTTVGVKIDKKVIEVEGESLNLMLWDLEGDDEFQKLRLSYLRGASGYLLVVDGTRRQTLDVALDLKQRVEDSVGVIPFICVLNKADLKEEWTLIEERLAELVEQGWSMVETSAKTGMGVEEAFGGLAGKLIAD
ncbi:MAG: GTP-binding protein [Gemmatimonadetes bacterium]|jgi:small GTP-binding protein|nr:GTP-binding protein [Gemmatimonadota bacterium]